MGVLPLVGWSTLWGLLLEYRMFPQALIAFSTRLKGVPVAVSVTDLGFSIIYNLFITTTKYYRNYRGATVSFCSIPPTKIHPPKTPTVTTATTQNMATRTPVTATASVKARVGSASTSSLYRSKPGRNKKNSTRT